MSLPSNGGAWLPDSGLDPRAYTLSGVVAATGLWVDQNQPLDSGFPNSNGYAKALPEGSLGSSHSARDEFSHPEYFGTDIRSTSTIGNSLSPSFISPFHSHVPCEQSFDSQLFEMSTQQQALNERRQETNDRPPISYVVSQDMPNEGTNPQETSSLNMPPVHFYNPYPIIINQIDASPTAFTPHLPLPGQDLNTSSVRNVQDRAWGEGNRQLSWTTGVSSEEIAASSNEGDESPGFDGSPEEQSFHAQLIPHPNSSPIMYRSKKLPLKLTETPEERRHKNRISATKSRLKKKVWVENLTAQVQELHGQNEGLKLVIDNLKLEKEQMQEELNKKEHLCSRCKRCEEK
ncbi:hypothetical protein BT69DRAFT_1287462 [Atractiella rhizophila]|nr:hypothetical protein BT69DRAFT_1287462 [Atractiella rhizophila]